MDKKLYINDIDAYATWGVLIDTQSLSALMTPPPQKERIKNKCRLRHGTLVDIQNPKVDARDITLTLQLVAKSEGDFFAKYAAFCQELQKGRINIRTDYQPAVVYRCDYSSCTQFTQFMRGIAKFSLKLNEPDPTDRS